MSTEREVAPKGVVGLKVHVRGVTAIWISGGLEHVTEYEGTLSEVVPEVIKDHPGARWRVERAGNGRALAEALIAHGFDSVKLVDSAEVHFNGDGCCGIVVAAAESDYDRGYRRGYTAGRASARPEVVPDDGPAGEVPPDLQLQVNHPSMFLRQRIAELERDKANLQRLLDAVGTSPQR